VLWQHLTRSKAVLACLAVSCTGGGNKQGRISTITWQPTRLLLYVSGCRMSSTSAAKSQNAASWFLQVPGEQAANVWQGLYCNSVFLGAVAWYVLQPQKLSQHCYKQSCCTT
jgi:hypothetical protein